ncbi:inheritance of peroxisomes protein 1-domain-containing protein [Neurospora crassa]|nr:inheritance of peroxisomes protein 1-domain-containing protein [Neurospora crassa]
MEFSNPFADTAPRRNFTAPIDSQIQRPSTSAGETSHALVDTLYSHPSVKIISFTAGNRPPTLGPTPPNTPTSVEPGSLPWSSHLERTIAVGHFRIYRAPGSITFLNCGSALQPIFPKSQAWCVDEDSSKFILQIRRPQYWRIEVPVDDPEDVRRAQLLREVFGQILQFEKTECPFQRSFTVELPERPQTPVIKKPWTPARRSSESIIPTPVSAITIPAQIARVHRGPPKDDTIRVRKRRATGTTSQSTLPTSDDLFRIQEHNIVSVPDITLSSQPEEEPQQPESLSSLSFTRTSLIPSGQQTSHSVAAPPQLTLITAPHVTEPSSIRQLDSHAPEIPGSQSSVTSRDSFHSVRSCSSHILPPSPPLSKPTSPSGSSCPPGKRNEPAEDSSTLTLDRANRSNISQTSDTSPVAIDRSATSSSTFHGTAPSSTHDTDSPCSPTTTRLILVTPSPNASPTSRSRSPSVSSRRSLIRGRPTTSSSISPSRRALSPLPRAADLFAPRRRAPSTSKLEVVRKLPMTVINKSFEILMAPPTHLMSLMLTVAARITAGQKSGAVLGSGEGGERIPVQWDLSDETEDTSSFPQRKSLAATTLFSSVRRWSVSHVSNDDDHLPPHMRGRERGMSLKMAGSFPESDEEGEHDDGDGGSTSDSSHGSHEPSARRNGALKADDGLRLDGAGIGGPEDDPQFDWNQSMGVD